MRLHLLPDEKIINRTIEIFEHVFPEGNKYVIFSRTDSCRYVSEGQKNVFVAKPDSIEFWGAIGNVKQYDSVIIHLMTSYAIDFINKIEHPSIYWIEWGVDLFDNMLEPRGFKMYFDEKIMFKYVYKSIKRRLAHKYCKFLFPSRATKNAIKKVKYFVPDSMYDEYPLLLKFYPQYNHLQYREFFYYPINQVVDSSIKDEFCHGRNIIVGNSGSFTGNHFEVIDILSKIDLGNRKVKFSLCYGGSEQYRADVVKMGQEMLGNKFEALTSYIPLDKYNQYLLDASFYIYNNYRQEAVGNILVALYFGGKVFLSDNSPLLTFYKKMGLVIFPVSALSDDILNHRLDKESVWKNRELIEKHYSLERLYSLVKQNFA